MIKKIVFSFLILIFSFLINSEVFGASIIPVEDVFLDIKKDYIYYNELQTLYDKGIIEPEIDHMFHPDKLLNRDEFVGIAEETSCKKCIIPTVDKEFLDIYKTNPFFDVGLNNKYFYCISNAKKDKFVLGYDAGVKCDNGILKSGEIPFCTNNNIKLEEALAVVMRMGGIMNVEEANIITNGIKNGQNYPNLSLDIKPKKDANTIYSFYPYFKKALEYEVIDYDNLGNKKTYKLVEKQGEYLRPDTLITKQDFLKMAFVALKANSCIETEKNNLALKIDIFDKSCTLEKAINGKCIISDLNKQENEFDFYNEVGGICDKGIDTYIWRFYNEETGEQIIKYGEFIDNYKFLTSGNYKVFLKVKDNCGNIGEVYNTLYIIDNKLDNTKISVSIKANPIVGPGPLEIDLQAIVNGGIGIYKYIWDFGDGNKGEGKIIKHIFIEQGTYNVKLTILDSEGNIAGSTVSIRVLDNNCLNDSDSDKINDCLDKCPLVKGTDENDGCPIFIEEDFSLDVGDCISKQDNNSYIVGNIVCNSCPCDLFVDFRAELRNCDTIIPAITSVDEKDIFARGKTYQFIK